MAQLVMKIGIVTNYSHKLAEYTVINSSVEKRAQNREKTTSGDYCIPSCMLCI